LKKTAIQITGQRVDRL
jgi:hypothetical protein